MASLIPARFLGVDGSLGSIAVGKRACFAIVDDKFQVQATIIDGYIVYATPDLADKFCALSSM